MYTTPDINPYFSYGPIISYRFIGGITKDKGKYRFRYELTFKNGETYTTQKSGFKTQREASKVKDILMHDLIQETYCPFLFTIKEYLDYWLYVYCLKEKEISYNTFCSYRTAIYKHILKSIDGSTKLSEVTSEMLLKALDNIKSDSGRHTSMNLLRNSFMIAHRKHYISFDPSAAAIEICKKRKPITTTKRNVMWSVETIKYVLYKCKENFPDMYLPLLLSLTLGTRISETLALKYTDIDFTAGFIHVTRQLGKSFDAEYEHVEYGEKKTKSQLGERYIPIPQWVSEEIIVKRAWYEEMKRKQTDFKDTNYICCKSDGSSYHRSYLGKPFSSLLGMCGLKQIHWHDLRHIYATMLKNNAVNVKAISTFLGHATPEFTEDVYIAAEEVAYYCTILTKIWNKLHSPQNKEPELLNIPLAEIAFKLLYSEPIVNNPENTG